MKLRIIAAVVCFGVMAEAQASEGLLFAAVYLCHAEEVNTAIVQHCSAQLPDLAPRAAAAYEKWVQTNKTRAATAKKICLQYIDVPYPGDPDLTPVDIKNRRDAFEENRKTVIADILKDLKAHRQPAARCKEIIAGMERDEPEGIFDDMIRKAKRDGRIKVDD